MKKIKLYSIAMLAMAAFSSKSQTLYVPSGSSGIGTSNTFEVGIKISDPQQNLHIFQDGIPFNGAGTPEQLSAGLRLDYQYLQNFQSKYSIWDVKAKEGGLDIYDENNGRSALFMSNDGNVGVGNTAPRQKLHVSGNILLNKSGNASNSLLFAGNVPTSSGEGHWGVQYVHTPTSGNQAGLNFWKPTGSANPGENFLYLADQGNIGIGTADPQSKLHVVGDLLVTGSIVSQSNNIINQYSQFNAHVDFGSSTDFEGKALFRDVTEFREKVSIGVDMNNLPGNYMLYVKDGILAESVKVAVTTSGDWADYVFAEDYNLMPLNEVEDYIKEHKHLPSVPSSDEMVESGLDLGKMDAKLLEKIEELTLYVIELKKENEQMKSQMAELIEAQD